MGLLSSVGVVLHPTRMNVESVDILLAWADGAGLPVYGLPDEVGRLDCAASPVAPEQLAQRSSLLVSLGGDGTMLRTMRLAAGPSTPVLGVNLGRLGFLAEVDLVDLPAALARLGDGEYRIEERMGLALSGHGLRCEPFGTTAFNDVVLTRVPGGGQAAVGISVGDAVLARWWGDGVIVATPTGSTAYSFAAGGPIVSPGVRGWIITPLAPHGTFHASFVVGGDEVVTVDVLAAGGPVAVELDGRPAGQVEPPGRVVLRPSTAVGRLIRLDRGSFYARARRKLDLRDPPQIAGSPHG
jgi:NAD+ kinase